MTQSNTRRNFLKKTGQGILAVPLIASLQSFDNNNLPLSNTKPQNNKPALKLNVCDYGAKGDGIANDTGAIQQTINRCHVLGGGVVFFPSGNFLTGAIQIRSNITLHLDKDAILTGTAEFADYPIMQVRWEGKWVQGHIGLIYAIDAENIGIKGNGKIAGNYALGGRPSNERPYRHPALIEPIRCKNIQFEDFSTDYFQMWSIHPTCCKNIQIKNLTIRSTGGNGDGIDIDSCKHVYIEGCDIATGDDCIAIKSGRGMEGYTLLQTTEDVQISNCKFSDSIFACIGIGSETSGGIRNIRIEHCTFTDTKTHAIYIKSRPGRGAFIEDITAKDLDISGMQGGFLRLNILGSGIQDQDPVPGKEGIPYIKNFSFSNIRVKDVAVLVEGSSIHPEKPLEGFKLLNVSGSCAKGITLANMHNALLKNITVTGFAGPLIRIHNVFGKGLENAEIIPFPHKLQETISEPNQPFQLK